MKCLAHGQQGLYIEPDEPWPSIVVKDMQVPQKGSFDEVRQEMMDEITAWNPMLRLGVKELWLMCRPEELTGKRTASVRVAFTDKMVCEQALTTGVFAFGERFRACRY